MGPIVLGTIRPPDLPGNAEAGQFLWDVRTQDGAPSLGQSGSAFLLLTKSSDLVSLQGQGGGWESLTPVCPRAPQGDRVPAISTTGRGTRL